MYKKISVIILVFIMITTVLSGCGSSSSTSSTSSNNTTISSPDSNTSTSEPGSSVSNESVKLVVWDEYTADNMKNASEKLNTMFQEANKNVTIERLSKNADVFSQSLKAAFMAGDAPDVMYHECGIGEMGPYVKSGYLLNLKDAYQLYGWDKTIMPVSGQVPSVTDFVWGVGSEIETMGLYYNKDVFDKLGLKTPATIEELTSDFAVIKKAGYVPLANTLDTAWWNNMNFIGTVLYSYMTADEIKAGMTKDASWDIEPVRKTVATIKDWLDKGYFPAHPEVDGDQLNFFVSQQSVCWINGNWGISDITDKGGKFATAAIPFPGSETCADGGSQVNFTGSGYMVNAATKNQKTALDYINFSINTPESAVIWSEIGRILPPYTGKYEAKTPELSKTISGYMSDEKIKNTAGINMWIGKNTFDFFSTAGQKLVIGSLDSDSFVKTLEAALQKDISEGNTKATFSLK